MRAAAWVTATQEGTTAGRGVAAAACMAVHLVEEAQVGWVAVGAEEARNGDTLHTDGGTRVC